MPRLNDWNERLVAYANSVNGARFRWGRTDCATLAHRAMRAMYGTVNPLGDGIEAYTSKASALKVGRAVGSPSKYLRSLGFASVGTNFAQSGDLVVFRGRSDGYPQIGVVVSGKLMVSDPNTGVELHRIGSWPKGTKLWRAPQ